MNILGTLLDIPEKTKNVLNAWRDLADLKIRLKLTSINGDKKKISFPLLVIHLLRKKIGFFWIRYK